MRTALLILVLLLPALSFADEDEKLPLPRFVSVRSDEVNIRTGPGVRYPIKWVIVKDKMPVEIIAEFEDWRKIRDITQDEGWAHKAMLSGRRTALVKGDKKNIFEEASDKSRVIGIANKNALLNISGCDGFFCEVETDKIDGFIAQENLWGIYEGEKFKR